MVGGSKRRSSAVATATTTNITSGSPSTTSPSGNRPPSTQSPLTAEELNQLLHHLATAISGSIRFLSSADLVLLPSQSLALESCLSSSALSLSTLLSLLPRHSFPLDRPPPSFPWFPRFLSSSFAADDCRWIESFRMSKGSFDALLETLAPLLRSDPSAAAAAIPPDVKVSAALFRLAHAAPYLVIARRFGLPSPDSACRAFYEVCKAITDRLGHLFELASDRHRVARGFGGWSLPNCYGVLGFTRFSVEGAARRGSMIAQVLVDSEGRFLDISAGWHGSMTPAQILTKTKLYKARALVLGTASTIELHGCSVPQYLLGGSCCPLLPWLLTPFRGTDSNLNSSKAATFNHVHASGMELAERVFGRLRVRWQLLQTSWKEDCADALPFVVVASCLLHNFLIKSGEPMEEEIETGVGAQHFPDFEGKDDEGGETIRDVLASHLSLSGHSALNCSWQVKQK